MADITLIPTQTITGNGVTETVTNDSGVAQGPANLGTGKGFGKLQYPVDYDSYSGAWLVFTEYSYSRDNRTSQPVKVATGTSICLPLPPALNSSYGAKWTVADMGAWGQKVLAEPLTKIAGSLAAGNPGVHPSKDDPVGGATAAAPTGWLDQFLGGADDKIKIQLAGILGEHWNWGSGLEALATDTLAATQMAQIGLRGVGLARNPFVATFFQNMFLKNYQFAWKLFPRNFKESQEVYNIIYALKYGMHPSYNDEATNNLFVYPNVYGLKFAGVTGAYLFNFGTCVIQGLDIAYHAEGTPLYFEHEGKKLPASMTISLTLGEVEINTKETIATGR